MKSASLAMFCGLSALCLTTGAAMSQDRLVGKLALTPVDGSCPATLALAAQAVPVDFLLPEHPADHPVVQNRFRFNYRDPVPVAHQVTISGKIADYGVPGCTVAFKGQGVSYD